VLFFVFPGPGALQKRSGRFLNASAVFCASNLHVAIDKVSIFLVFTMLGVLLPALRGKHISEATQLQLGIIIVYICCFPAFCSLPTPEVQVPCQTGIKFPNDKYEWGLMDAA